MRRLEQILIERGLVTADQVRSALEAPGRATEETLLFTLAHLGHVDERQVVNFLSRDFAFPVVDPTDLRPDDNLLHLVPERVARRHLIVPIAREGAVLTIVTADPTDIAGIDEVRFLSGCTVKVSIAPVISLEKTVRQLYDEERGTYSDLMLELANTTINVAEDESGESNVEALQAAGKRGPIVRLVNTIILAAVDRKASDIHLEPYEDDVRVRFRVDGVLYEWMNPPRQFHSAIVSRIKIMASLDIAERRRPQDGRIRMRVDGQEYNFRVSIVPAIHGEKVVLRILDKSQLRLSLSDLGLDNHVVSLIRDNMARPYGMILVTGPTGSGKTTTLYAALSEINNSIRNISSVEDPVEVSVRGINQVNVNPEIGVDFANVLRSFLRQDPDVVFVGEIRDRETAEISVRAALTGHLVLSTLHTNDAPSAVTRLLDMGVDSFLVSGSVNAVLAQRLVRVPCTRCRTLVSDYPPELLRKLGFKASELKKLELWRGVGCDDCGKTGYSGRTAIIEAFGITDAVRERILRKVAPHELRQHAIKEGMVSLREAGLTKIRQGRTTVEEVIRVTEEGEPAAEERKSA